MVIVEFYLPSHVITLCVTEEIIQILVFTRIELTTSSALLILSTKYNIVGVLFVRGYLLLREHSGDEGYVVVVVVVSHIQRIGCQPEKTTLHGGQSRSWSAEQGKENKRKSLAAYPPPPHPPHCSFGENK